MSVDYDIIIIGAGLVGLSTALACAYKGATIALIDTIHPLNKPSDGRASSIAVSSIQMFEKLAVAPQISEKIQPITDMIISDGGVGHVSGLNLHFDSRDVNSPTSYMVENDDLRGALFSAVDKQTNIHLIAPTKPLEARRESSRVTVSLSNNTKLTSSLLVAADGRNSVTRKSAGIGVIKQAYKQKALITTFRHEFPHDGTAHQIFFPGGPLALLPLTENRMSIVWSDKIAAIEAAMLMSEAAFMAELRRRIGDFLGETFLCADRQSYPLSLQMADSYIGLRLALVGDAAHAIHPLAGQGLNMGIRDAAALADVIAQSRMAGLDIGGADLDNYAAWRNFDNQILATSTDILSRVFSNNTLPLRHGRRLGLAAINRSDKLKAFFMNEASGQTGDVPTLLR